MSQQHDPQGAQSAVLAAQRAYIRKLDEQGFGFGLTVAEAFVRGIRDLGYRSNADAFAELIDNSIQAFATRVDILFGYEGGASEKKPRQIAVVDDGCGMEAAMLRLAVTWGGTHRENDRAGLGRYGYGLPCSAVSVGRRFTVYSKTADSDLMTVTLDLDELTDGEYTNAGGEIVVPPPARAHFPQFVEEHLAAIYPQGWRSGTIVLIDKLDRLERSTSGGLRENLSRQFGVIYHKLRSDAALYVDCGFVEPMDPLFLTPGYRHYDLDEDRAQAFDPLRIEVTHPETGRYMGAVLVRYAWLPPSFGSVDKRRDAIGGNANARFPIMRDRHGVIFSRMGRLIDVQTRTPWTTFINNDRYAKLEIEFPASLDEEFGVTTSKQQVTVSPRMWDLLKQHGVPKAIEQLRGKVREAKLDRREALSAPIAEAFGPKRDAQSGDDLQLLLGLPSASYEVSLDHRPGEAFFRLIREAERKVLCLNTAHAFYGEAYGPRSTQEVRSALERLLICIGEIAAAAPSGVRQLYETELIPCWSVALQHAMNGAGGVPAAAPAL